MKKTHKQVSLMDMLRPGGGGGGGGAGGAASPKPDGKAPGAAAAGKRERDTFLKPPTAAAAGAASPTAGGGGGGKKRERESPVSPPPTAAASSSSSSSGGGGGASTRSHDHHRDTKRVRTDDHKSAAAASSGGGGGGGRHHARGDSDGGASFDVSDIRHDTKDAKFRLPLPSATGGGRPTEAFAEYRFKASTPSGRKVIDLFHTYVPSDWQGKGLAAIVCTAAFEYAVKEGAMILPSCSYVHDTYLPAHERYKTYAAVLPAGYQPSTKNSSKAGGGGGGGDHSHHSRGHAMAAAAGDKAHAHDRDRKHEHSAPAASAAAAAAKHTARKPDAHHPAAAAAATAAAVKKAHPSGGPKKDSSGELSDGARGRAKSPDTPPAAAAAAAGGAAAASSSSSSGVSSAVPEGHVPLPHHPLFSKRWSKLASQLAGIRNSESLVTAIWELNAKKKNIDRSMKGLTYYLQTCMVSAAKEQFYAKTVPYICSLITDLPRIFPSAVLPLLRSGKAGTLELTAEQAACISACGFFLLHAEFANSNEKQYQSANFDGIYSSLPNQPAQQSKLKCIIHYFTRIAARPKAEMLSNHISYHRLSVPTTAAAFQKSLDADRTPLTALDTREVGTIEDDGLLTLQIDFANKHIGGGVLGHGCIQEEIRFVINPECLPSLLFCETMAQNESIIICGAERFSNYTGYSNSFRWSSDHKDFTPREPAHATAVAASSDSKSAHRTAGGRLCTVIVAIDAIRFPSNKARDQFRVIPMTREILKAYVGFAVPNELLPQPPKGWNTSTASASSSAAGDKKAVTLPKVEENYMSYSAISTGNWGCGAFNGDVPLKSMLQWIAAAKAGRSIRYFTFGDRGANGLLHTALSCTSGHIRVDELWAALTAYSTAIGTGVNPIPPAPSPLPRKASSSAAAAAGDKPAGTARKPSKDVTASSSSAAAAGAVGSPTAADAKPPLATRASGSGAGAGAAAIDIEASAPPEDGEMSIAEMDAAISAAYEEDLAAAGDVPDPDSPRAETESRAAAAAASASRSSGKFPTVFEYIRYRFANRTTGPRLTENGSIEFATGSGNSASGEAIATAAAAAAGGANGHSKPAPPARLDSLGGIIE